MESLFSLCLSFFHTCSLFIIASCYCNMLIHVLLYVHALITSVFKKEHEISPFVFLPVVFVVFSVHSFRKYSSEVVCYTLLWTEGKNKKIEWSLRIWMLLRTERYERHVELHRIYLKRVINAWVFVLHFFKFN
jgi:hypothetical protein